MWVSCMSMGQQTTCLLAWLCKGLWHDDQGLHLNSACSIVLSSIRTRSILASRGGQHLQAGGVGADAVHHLLEGRQEEAPLARLGALQAPRQRLRRRAVD